MSNILSDNRYLHLNNLNLGKKTIDAIIKTIIIIFNELYNQLNQLDQLTILNKNFSLEIESNYCLKTFLVFMILNNKIHEKNFVNELEKNYGVFLDGDSFIQEMNQKVEEVKNISDSYKYFGNSKNLLNEILFNSCNSKLDKIIIANDIIDERSKKEMITKTKKHFYKYFKIYDCRKYKGTLFLSYLNQAIGKNVFIDPTNLKNGMTIYKRRKKKIEKEKRKIRDMEIINKRKKMKIPKIGNKKVFSEKQFKKNFR